MSSQQVIPDSQDIIRLSGELAYQYISYCQFVYYAWIEHRTGIRFDWKCYGHCCDHLDKLLSTTIKRLLLRFLDNSSIQKLVLDNPNVISSATQLWLGDDWDLTHTEQGLLVIPIYKNNAMKPFFLTTN